jgi:membrane protease YdiL (CAAX protease family)
MGKAMSSVDTPIRNDRAAAAMCERFGLPVVIAAIFALSWIGTIPQLLASWHGASSLSLPLQLLQPFILAPGLVALGAAWLNGGWLACRHLLGRLLRWRATPFLYAAVLVGPPALMLGSILLSNALGYTALRLPAASDALAAFMPNFLVYLLLNTEELTWRGYVLPRMQRCWNPLLAALVLGVIWTAFHVPYFFMKGGHPGGYTPLLFVVSLLPMSVLLTRTFNAAAGSVLLPHLLHQSVNAWAEALPYLPRFTGSNAPVAISVAIAFALAVFAIVAWPSMWTRR